MVHPHEEFKEDDPTPKPMLEEVGQLMHWLVDHMAGVLGRTQATYLLSQEIAKLHDQVRAMQEKLLG